MSQQTSVSLSIQNATPGLIADIHAGNQIISAAAETAPPAVIGFGLVVSRGSDPDNQAVIGGDATGILGVTVRSVGKEAASIGATSLVYENTEAMAIMQSGYIMVTAASGASPGDPVKFDNATGVIDSGAPAAGETTITNAEWMETVEAGAIGKIRIDSVVNLVAGA